MEQDQECRKEISWLKMSGHANCCHHGVGQQLQWLAGFLDKNMCGGPDSRGCRMLSLHPNCQANRTRASRLNSTPIRPDLGGFPLRICISTLYSSVTNHSEREQYSASRQATAVLLHYNGRQFNAVEMFLAVLVFFCAHLVGETTLLEVIIYNANWGTQRFFSSQRLSSPPLLCESELQPPLLRPCAQSLVAPPS
jgi:hypothetical protein